jgi:hypothetical protein
VAAVPKVPPHELKRKKEIVIYDKLEIDREARRINAI